jgi:drug/metabolite transporter (DMT)-like permease
MRLPSKLAAWEDVALILAVGGLFGATFVLIKFALGSIPPFTLGWLRLVIAAGPLLLVLRWNGLHLPPLGSVWLSFTVMGLGNGALAYVLINWSAQYIEAGLVGILIAATPLFTALLGWRFASGEPMTLLRFLAVVVGFLGVTWLIGPDALQGLGWQGMRLWGELAMLGAALCYAVAALHGRVLQHVSPLVTATAQQITGAVAMTPIVLLFESPLALQPRGEHLLAILAGGVFGTSLAYLLFFRLLARAGATRAILVTYVTPISALLFGAVFLGERVPLRAYGAIAVILLSITLVSGRLDGILARGRRALRARAH